MSERALPDLVGRAKLDTSHLERGAAKAKSEVASIGPASAKSASVVDQAFTRSTSNVTGRFGLLGSAAQESLGGISSRATASGAVLGTAMIAGAAVAVDALQSTVTAASDLAEQVAAAVVVFGSGAPIVQAFGKGTADSLGISERAALETANSFGDLFLNVGFTEKQAAHLSIAMVQLAGDLASFKNLGTEEVLEKLRSGIVGETEPLRALGIVMNESSVKAKAMELGLGGAHRELTDGEKIAARYALIIEKTKNAQGDAARTADSFANQQRRLAAEAENTRAAIGAKLTPAVAEFQQFSLESLNSVDKLVGLGGEGGLSSLVEHGRKAPGAFTVLNSVMGLFSNETDKAASTARLLEIAEKDLGLASGTLAEFTKDEAKAHEIAAQAAEEHTKQIERQNNAMLAAFDVELGYERSLNSLEDAHTDVAEAQKASTDAIRAHGPKSAEAAAAAEALSRAQLDLRGDLLNVAQASATMAQAQAVAKGEQFDSVDAARAQIGALEELKKKFPDLTAVIDAYIKKLNEIPGVKNTNVTINGGRAPTLHGPAVPQRMAGGGAEAGQPYIVGERRAELFVPDVDGYVLPTVPSWFRNGTAAPGGPPSSAAAHGVTEVPSSAAGAGAGIPLQNVIVIDGQVFARVLSVATRDYVAARS